ncbi:MAG: hypothetical protein SXG53_03045 [Pseudomonadota bacterium]|nr:hypothetical protein [Pseudomonadota bacterium]
MRNLAISSHLIEQRESHTHPHDGSSSLSRSDVRGAYDNRHINCHSAFYSTPSGEILAWDAHHSSVPVAMASRARIGNYKLYDAS